MSPIRLIALDLDDTVVTRDLTIPAAVRQAIAEALRRGVVVVLATGRMFRSARPFAEALGIDAPLITYNGALVRDLAGKVYAEQPLPKEYVGELAEFARAEGVTLNLYVDDTLCVEQMNDDVAYYLSIARVEPRIVGDLVAVARSLAPGERVHKALFVADPDRAPRLLAVLQQRYAGRLEVVPSQARFIELTDLGVSKGRALAALCRSLGIPREQVLAVGDNFNDVTMLQFAGIGIAMGSAPEAVKQIADAVVGTSEEGGVAEAIERYVLAGRA